MSAYANQPININFLSPVGFAFKIKKAPHLNYFIQSASIPGVSIAPIDVPNPFSKVPFVGSQLTYDTLSVTFKVDEDMKNYMEIYDWLIGMGFPKEFDQYQQIAVRPTGEGIFSDLTLIVNTSAKNPNIEVTYYDAFPTSISALTFDTTSEDIAHITCTVEFKYGRYVINTIV